MKCFVLVSHCMSIDLEKGRAAFHFKGVYSGHSIDFVNVHFKGSCPFSIKTDYVLYLGYLGVKEKFLEGKLIKVKKIGEIKSFI